MLALELTGFLDGDYVAHGVTAPFHALGGHHRLITAHITAGPPSWPRYFSVQFFWQLSPIGQTRDLGSNLLAICALTQAAQFTKERTEVQR